MFNLLGKSSLSQCIVSAHNLLAVLFIILLKLIVIIYSIILFLAYTRISKLDIKSSLVQHTLHCSCGFHMRVNRNYHFSTTTMPMILFSQYYSKIFHYRLIARNMINKYYCNKFPAVMVQCP